MILLDVMMPGLDGWRVAEELLEDPETSAIPIVFLTARAELRDRARGLDLGGLDYVTKPFNPVELAPLIRDVIARVEGGEREELRRAKLAELRTLIEERLSQRARLREHDRRQHDRAADELRRARGVSSSQAYATMLATTGSTIAMIPARVARDVPHRADDQEERDDRPEHDHPGHQRPDRQVAVGEVAEQRDRPARARRTGSSTTAGRSPRRRRRRGTRSRGARRVALARPRARRGACSRRRCTAEQSEKRTPSPSSETPCQRSTTSVSPTSASASAIQSRRAHVLLQHEVREQRDEQRPEVLDQQRDPDVEPVDREEVEELHERDAEDAEDREVERARAGRCAALAGRVSEHDREQAEQRAGAAHLGQPQRRESRLEDHLRDRAVDREQRPRGKRHRVADRGAALLVDALERGSGRRRTRSRAGYPPTLTWSGA